MKNHQFMEIKNNNHSKKVKISIKTAEELAHMDFPDREWLIKDLWREREHMMIFHQQVWVNHGLPGLLPLQLQEVE